MKEETRKKMTKENERTRKDERKVQDGRGNEKG
jgi:hypothetical protein